MGKVYFIFGVHNHQPVGNFPHIFKKAFDESYNPFLCLLDKFPSIKAAIHLSGPLYDWIIESAPRYLSMLKKMVKRGQVEIISGGYYEPLLPLISDCDKAGQIDRMNEFIKSELKYDAKGIWIAERVWEQYLTRMINSCGLRYTFLDDTHFRYAGLQEKEFFGYYTTEDNGKFIQVFPISKTLRYKIPFSKAHEAIDILKGFQEDDDILVTLFDDGEKFGLWPNTYEWVYQKGWLNDFFCLLDKNQDIVTIKPQDAINKFASKGIIYLPAASYEEMGEWVLGPKAHGIYKDFMDFLKSHSRFDDFKDFIRGGYFRNFMRKYKRLNYMHKRMLMVSSNIHNKADKARDKAIFTNLWKAQTNCGYWHGIFGGFYLGHIRSSIYEHLIRAETLFDKKYCSSGVSFQREDIDGDGDEEIIIKNSDMVCCFSPRGGSLIELSLRKKERNLINTITRRRESYHEKLGIPADNSVDVATIHDIIRQKERGLDKLLIYDSYERLGFIEHIVKKGLTLEDFNLGQNFISLSNNKYDSHVKKEKDRVNVVCHFKDSQIDYTKTVTIGKLAQLDAQYKISSFNPPGQMCLAVEFNLSFPSIEHIKRKEKAGFFDCSGKVHLQNESSLTLVDTYQNITADFEFDTADIFSMPVYSVSSSESGFEKVYQQISILFIFKQPKKGFSISLRIK
ncbi:MAG: alpha-amylase/4-alpha-glucanotransferase domain-containing protein [Candidatus Omnitrophota bacterium]